MLPGPFDPDTEDRRSQYELDDSVDLFGDGDDDMFDEKTRYDMFDDEDAEDLALDDLHHMDGPDA
jgi:hypothetical protein